MKKIRAIVLLFNGEEVTDLLISKMALMVKNHCELNANDEVSATVCSGTEISDIIGDYIGNLTKNPNNEGTCKTPEDNAAFFIGKKMAKYLGKNFNSINFSAALVQKLAKAHENPKDESNKAFLNAIEILKQPHLNISKAILDEVNLNEKIITLIQTVCAAIPV